MVGFFGDCIILDLMYRSKIVPGYVVLSLALLSCASTPPIVPPGTACETLGFTIIDDFPGARRGSCEVLSDTSARITIVPEDSAVNNPSPWFAFKLLPSSTPVTAIVEIDYVGAQHRYVPKTSNDGSTWRRVGSGDIEVREGGSTAVLSVALRGQPVWVAAQELIVDTNYTDWYAAMSSNSRIEIGDIGRSLEGRPLTSISHETDASQVVLLVGRQHPPEVSGALAMRTFIDTVFADTALAQAFRKRFRVIAIPLLNPDGVVRGHWRHNAGGVDLNRDWGPFTQPETLAMERLLDELDAAGDTLRLFLDFHSTERNLFYTQMPDDPTDPPDFAGTWLGNARERLEDYAFSHEPRPASEAANGKQYMYRRYAVPSMTYEVGDETDRSSISSSAEVFAEELMRELLGL